MQSAVESKAVKPLAVLQCIAESTQTFAKRSVADHYIWTSGGAVCAGYAQVTLVELRRSY